MARFKVSAPFTVAFVLLVPTYSEALGVPVKAFPEVSKGIPFNGNFKTFGGTEVTMDGLYSIQDTAWVESWYMPEIKSDCRVVVRDTGAVYEVYGEPENIELRNQYLKFKIRRVKGGA